MTTAAVTVEDLQAVDLFDGVGEEELARWVAVAAPFTAEPGEVFIEQDEISRGLVLLLEGTADARLLREGREEPVGRHHAPTWIGAIAALTGSSMPVRMSARTPCRGVRIPREAFLDLLLADRVVHQRVAGAVAPVMSRISAREQDRERLASLGTMAAGLAHELNNPAAAAKRAAAELVDALDAINGALAGFVEGGLERTGAEHLLELQRVAVAGASACTRLEALDRADLEDDMRDTLEDLGVPEAWKHAEPLAAAGVDRAWLDDLIATTGDAAVPAIRWVSATLSANALATELQDSAERMGRLVGAVKTYAYMDRGEVVEADVHEGLETTLIMLGHKLKGTRIEVVREYEREVPKLMMHGSELNQVWTNLIDNAIAALGEAGTITIRTRRDGSCVEVEVADDGPGIPEEARAHVFDPFFTTKPVGQGTGLGLDTARRIVEERHDGSLSFTTSEAGTTFLVRLPLDAATRG